MPGGQEPDALRRVVAEDRLEVHLLAEPVDAAIGEDRAAQQRLRLVEVERDAELPRQDAFVPVAADVGDVAVLLRRDDERELPPVARRRAARRLRARSRRRRAGGAGPDRLLSRSTIETFAPRTGAPLSRRVTKTSVFCGLSLTVIPRFVTWTSDGADAVSPSLRCLASRVNRIAFLDRGPHEARAARSERAATGRGRATGCDPA